jgi:hypothetical protein
MVKIGAVCLTILLASLVAGSMADAYVTTMGAVTTHSMFPGMGCPPPACYPPTCPPQSYGPPACPPPMCRPITKVKQRRGAPMAMAAPVCGPGGCYPGYGGYGMQMHNPQARWQ